MILDNFPTILEFYEVYWNKKPFLVKRAVSKKVFEGCIDGDTLAGLSLEDEIKSRLIFTKDNTDNLWSCEHGPFENDRFYNLPPNKWSLLVQNVEQYHRGTASLLKSFNFAPRWLMDDIMVSYSTPEGTVGAHTDSYHVFLVQGIGKRKWRVSEAPIKNPTYQKDQDLKILKEKFHGQTYDVEIGDVLYIPPHFAHEGITVETALTFSIGFLGPTYSEILSEYAYYLDRQETERYCGGDLGEESAGAVISENVQKTVQQRLIEKITSDDFSLWISEYFSMPTHTNLNVDMPVPIDLEEYLKTGVSLKRAQEVKVTVTLDRHGYVIFGAGGDALQTSLRPQDPFVLKTISGDDIKIIKGVSVPLEIVEFLLKKGCFFL